MCMYYVNYLLVFLCINYLIINCYSPLFSTALSYSKEMRYRRYDRMVKEEMKKESKGGKRTCKKNPSIRPLIGGITICNSST